MRLTIVTLIVLAAIVHGQDVPRCGPWYANQACPFNANGLGGQLYCTRFGFCSPTASDGSSTGVYVKMDGDCVSQPDMNAYCKTQLDGSTCSFAEKRCQIAGLDHKKFDGLGNSDTTTTTTTNTGTGTTGGTSTSGGVNSNTAPVAASSSMTLYPSIVIATIVALMAAAVYM